MKQAPSLWVELASYAGRYCMFQRRWILMANILIVLIGVAWVLVEAPFRSPETEETAVNAELPKTDQSSSHLSSSAASSGATPPPGMITAEESEERRRQHLLKIQKIVQKAMEDGIMGTPVSVSTEAPAPSQEEQEERAKQILAEKGPLEAAQYLIGEHRYDELTVSLARQAVEAEPDSVEGLFVLGMVLRNPQERVGVYQQILELDPNSIEALVRLSGDLAQSQPMESIGYSNRLVELASSMGNERLWRGYFHQGLAYERLGKYDEAIEAYGKARPKFPSVDGRIQLIREGNPIFPPLDLTSSSKASETGQETAIGDTPSILPPRESPARDMAPVVTSIGSEPGQSDVDEQLSQGQASGMVKDVTSQYERLVAENPEAVSKAHYEYAQGLVKEGRFREAAEDLRRAIELNPKHTDSYRELARVYERTQDTERAAMVYQKALARFPEDEQLQREWETFRDKHLRDDAPKRPEQDK